MKTIDGDVNLTELHFKEIPEILKDVHIKGNFYIPYNRLRNLNNSPAKVNYIFNCSANRIRNFVGGPKEIGELKAIMCGLTSLEGFPKIVKSTNPYTKGRVDISHNDLTSLVGLPESISGNLMIGSNPLKSLQGCSRSINGDFEAFNTQITSMIGGPEIIRGECFVNETELTSLEGFPKRIDGNLFIGDTPLWNDLMKKTGSSYKVKQLLSDLLRSIKCRLDGDIYEDESDYDNAAEEMSDDDYEPDYEPDEFGRLRRV